MPADLFQETSLQQLSAVPGVVGSMVFDREGAVVASRFPAVFDTEGLRQLAGQLSADAYFQDWLTGEGAALDLRFADGHVVVRSVGPSWLLVLCTAPTNAQLLTMSLTQVVRRLRLGGGSEGTRGSGSLPLPAKAPSVLDRLRDIARAELGDHAAQALEILTAAGSTPKDLLKATAEIEKLTRLFISKKKADEIGRRLRQVIET
jgi:predicted regulator of Ras-like GTPase activity (Roadblock/LC7/MglB family)